MNLENSITPDAHRLKFNLKDKTNLLRGENYVSLSSYLLKYMSSEFTSKFYSMINLVNGYHLDPLTP